MFKNNKMKGGNTVAFKNPERQMMAPFVIYVYFEEIRKTFDKPRANMVLEHQPCGFSYTIKCCFDESLCKQECYYGSDCIDFFWHKIQHGALFIHKQLRHRADSRQMTEVDQNSFNESTHCYYCHEPFQGDKHPDFFRWTGEYLGGAHRKCVQNKIVPSVIPVILQNLSKRWAPFLIHYSDINVEYVRETEHTYITCSKILSYTTLQFIGSERFLKDKLENLAELLEEKHKTGIRRMFPEERDFQLMNTPTSFPHTHLNSFDKLEDTFPPPPRGFHDVLQEDDVSEEEYQRAIEIWNNFHCSTLGDYVTLHLKNRVLLLEDIFEKFRELCLLNYDLDPVYYWTIAALAWDIMLKITGVKLEVMDDKGMTCFLRSSMRGGIVQCSKRYSKANNKYCQYDTTQPPTFIVYLDANNLAGWAMSQHLPFSDFSWLSKEEIVDLQENIDTLKADDHYGYILEVDLDYPSALHHSHNDFPFCSEFDPTTTKDKKKQILTLHNKNNYVIHYMNLKQCLENGLVLTTIHRVLRFRQTKWLEPFVTFNTNMRANATNDFEVALYKLLNNSVYGKTIQKSSKDKPIYAGFCILELSKKLMYDFHYKHMTGRYDHFNLLYMDTDAFVYEIQTKDFYADLRGDRNFLELFDTSDMDTRWRIPPKHKKVLGKMKDEYEGKVIREFCGVGAKYYCLDVEGEEIKKAAGVPKYVKKNHLTNDDYKKCVLNDEHIRREILITEPKDHKVYTRHTSKTLLSPGDRKREVLSNKVDTHAWGYQDYQRI